MLKDLRSISRLSTGGLVVKEADLGPEDFTFESPHSAPWSLWRWVKSRGVLCRNAKFSFTF